MVTHGDPFLVGVFAGRADPQSASDLRAGVEAELIDLAPADAVESVALAVGELLRLGCALTGRLTVRLRREDDAVRVDVDHAPEPDGAAAAGRDGQAGPAQPDELAAAVLTALTSDWGMQAGPTGHHLWCTVGFL